MTSQPLPILVVSMAHCQQRRASMAEQLERLGLAYEFLDAVDGRQLPAEFLAERAQRRGIIAGGSAAVLPTEIGCALSHVACAQRIVERGWPGAVVLEDDAQLLPAFADFVRHFDPQSRDWRPGSVAILGGLEDERRNQPDRKRLIMTSLYRQIRVTAGLRVARTVKSHRYFIRTCGYYIDALAAQRLAQYNREAETVADNWRQFLAAGVIAHLYVPRPWLLWHPPEATVHSLIEPERATIRQWAECRRRGRLSRANLRLKNTLQPLLRRIYCLLP